MKLFGSPFSSYVRKARVLRHPQLKQWVDGIAARNSFEATLPPDFVRP
jgi:glutathione S-transferase